ncbi:Hypothetical protein, putative [Bodo saltans]|uniref:Membrane-associated protein n=1 Tax=Bodo saltans TaxID=75058 RepID=A0A0S4J8S7_BODSA|nr:Hypothetical protein, putative [Bodo saltans]|eukprot:CUG86933.1 Hypothetical protein, putative [Bodo saltans]
MLNGLLILAFAVSLVHPQTQSCEVRLNMNVTHMPPSIIPPQFATSALDCCDLCNRHSNCVAAVWYSYYCHMLTTTAGIEPMVPTPAVDVLLRSQATTTTTTTTPVPVVTTTTTTAAPMTPQPTPAPAPTSPPLFPPALSLIRRVVCDASSTCNSSQDATCISQVFYNYSCNGGGQLHYCDANGSDVTTASYQNMNCTMFDFGTSGPANVCEPQEGGFSGSGSYLGKFCDVMTEYPLSYITVERVSCPSACNDGIGCSSPTLVTGVCSNNTMTSLLSGSTAVIAWCYPEYVVYIGYEDPYCEQPAVEAFSENLACTQDYRGNYVQNNCML